MNKTLLYTHPDCDICATVKMDLAEKNVSYEEIDLELNPDRWYEVETLTRGDRITPVLVQDGEVTIGYHGIGCSFYD